MAFKYKWNHISEKALSNEKIYGEHVTYGTDFKTAL